MYSHIKLLSYISDAFEREVSRNEAANNALREENRSLKGENESLKEENESLKEQLKQQSEKIEEQTKCKICLSNDMSITLLPCGHVICCECSAKITECSFCRTDIQKKHKSFIVWD